VKSIFISSTYRDLINERDKSIETVDNLDSAKAIAMERISSDPNPPKEVCLSYLRKCDAVVLILGNMYSSEDIDEKISITEIEYNEAKVLDLPVFVFKKNNSEGDWEIHEEDIEKKEKLENFKRRLDSERTRVTFQTTEELGRKIAIAIYNHESENGEIGIRNRQFLTGNSYFKPFINQKNYFNHCHPFFGRSEVFENLCKFIESKKPVLIIHGRGGIGKSKLLFELFTKYSEDTRYKLWFLRENAQISDDSIRQISLKKKNIIVVDDAHRQTELKTLQQIALENPEHIRLIFTVRNYGFNPLRSQLIQSGYNPGDIEILPELVELKRQEMESLADSILDDSHKIFRDALVSVARDSPLVLVIGAKFVNENSIDPALLERNKDFQLIVFDKFTDIQMGNISDKFDKKDVKKILTLFSALQPVDVDNSKLLDMISKSVEIPKHELNLIIAELESAGVLLKKGRIGLRITPDVFSDYILGEACVANNRLTGYAEKVFDEFYDISPNELILNFAELDWRVQNNGSKIGVMNQVWEKILKTYQQSSNLGRYLILTNIEKIAYLQPLKSLDLVEYALANPSDDNEGVFGLTPYTHENVKSAIPKILQNISYNIKYLPKCCDVLWILGKDKEGILSSDTTHPIRILQDIAEYKSHKPLEIQSIILESVQKWLRDPKVHDCLHTPLDIIDPIFKKDGEDSRFTGRTFEFSPFVISYKNTQEIRKRALSIIFSSTNGKSTRIVMRCINSLMDALHPPRALFGRKISEEEYNQWHPEETEILNFIGHLAKNSQDPIVQISIHQHLQWYSSYQRNEENRKKSDAIIKSVKETYEVRLVRSLMYTYDRNRPRDFLKENKIIDIKIQRTINEFVSKSTSYFDSYSTLLTYLNKLNSEKVTSNPGRFFYLLGKQNPEFAHEICRIILSDSNPLISPFFSAILSGIKEIDQSIAKNLIIIGLQSQNDSIHKSIAFGYSCGWWQGGIKKDEFPLVVSLLKSQDKDIKRLAIASFAEFPQSEEKRIKKVALALDIESNFSFADALCKIFFSTSAKLAIELTKNEIKKMMMKFIPISSLQRQSDTTGFYVCNFFKYAGEKNPDAIISLLLERIKYAEKTKRKDAWDRYEPIPFLPSFDCFESLFKHTDYQKLLKKVRDDALQTDKKTYYRYLFSIISNNYSIESLQIFEDWIDSDDEEKILLICEFVRNAPPEFLLDNSPFVDRILETSNKINEGCHETVKENLLSMARCGPRSGTIGEPFPLDVKIKAVAEELSKRFPHGSVTEKFYTELAEKAGIWMKQSIMEDDDLIE
jgi:hypothetical protein